MKKFEKDYKKLMDNVELLKIETEAIKDRIVSKKNKFININTLVTLSVIVLIFTIGISVNALVNHYMIIKNEEFTKKTFFNGYIDAEYKSDLFLKGENYDIKEIEKKLDLKFLRNEYIKESSYNLYNITIKEDNIIKLNFWLRNTNNINIGFEVNTNENVNSEFSISGNVDLKKYNVKNLNTEALIYETRNEYAGPLLANFEYNGIIYSVELDKSDYSLNDLYKILDSFYK